MKVMILAAGYGTRLKPYTDSKPKALIEINGTPMLELLIKKLIKIGVTDIIINVHHFAEIISDYLKRNDDFGINIQLSFEEQILGTGGGIKKAAYFFNNEKPFIVHNVDIISDIDLVELYQYHISKNYLATLVVKHRDTKRYFIVDQQNLICGHLDVSKNSKRLVRKNIGATRNTAFSGIHVISPEIFPYITESGFVSIVDVYLRLIEKGYSLGTYNMDQYYWKDLGKIETITEVEDDIREGLIAVSF